MRCPLALFLVTIFGLIVTPARATLQSDYLEIYLRMNEAAQLEAKGDNHGALTEFEDCYTRLHKIHASYPQWEDALVTTRMGDCRAKILEVESKIAPVPKKPVAPETSPLVATDPTAPKIQLAELQQAVKTSPNDPSAYRNLGVAYFQLGQIGPAIDSLQHAVTLEPNNVANHNFLGCVYMRKGRQESAAKEFRKAIELDETCTDAHYNLAILYATEDPPAMNAAKTHYKRALQLGLIPDPHLAKVLHVPAD